MDSFKKYASVFVAGIIAGVSSLLINQTYQKKESPEVQVIQLQGKSIRHSSFKSIGRSIFFETAADGSGKQRYFVSNRVGVRCGMIYF